MGMGHVATETAQGARVRQIDLDRDRRRFAAAAPLRDPIDVLFIDADKPGYADYLKKLLPLVRPGGLIIAHNMHRPAPSPDFIKAITTDPELESLFLNMHAAGIAVTLKKR